MKKKFKDKGDNEVYFQRFDRLIKKKKQKVDLSKMSPYEIINYLRENDVKKNYKVLPSNKFLHRTTFISFCMIFLVLSYGVTGSTFNVPRNIDVFVNKDINSRSNGAVVSSAIDYMVTGDIQGLIDIYKKNPSMSIEDHFEFITMLRTIGNLDQARSEIMDLKGRIEQGTLVRNQEVNSKYIYRLLNEMILSNELEECKKLLDKHESSMSQHVLFKEKKIIYNLLVDNREEAQNIYNSIDINSISTVDDMVSFSKLSVLFNRFDNALNALNLILSMDNENTDVISIIQLFNSYDSLAIGNVLNSLIEITSDNVNLRLIRAMLNAQDLSRTQENLEDVQAYTKVNKDSLLSKSVKLDILSNAKRQEESLVIVNELKNIKDKNYFIDYILARYSFKNENYNEALNYAKDSLNSNRNFFPCYDLITDILILENKISNLNYFYLKMKSLDILNTSVDKEFILKYTDSFNDTDKALHILEFSNKISIYDADLKYRAAKIYIDQRKDNEAKEKLYEAINLNNKAIYYRTLGVLLVSMGEVELGIENIRHAYELDPNDILNLNNAAAYYANVEKNIQKAFSNIKASYEGLNESYSQYESFIIRENYFKLDAIYDHTTGEMSSEEIPYLDYLY